MRGRDNGLADYNTVRKCFGLPMINHFSEINQQQFAKHPDMFARLEEVYGGKISEHAKKYIYSSSLIKNICYSK